MRIFVDQLRYPHRGPRGENARFCHLLSDNLADLKTFAGNLGLNITRLQWSDTGTPYYVLSSHLRYNATLDGAIDISLDEAADLNKLWWHRSQASLSRLLHSVPYLAAKLKNRPQPH